MPEGSCFCCFFMVCTYEVPHMEKWPVNMTHELFSNMQGVNSKTSKRSHFKLKPKGLTFSCLYNHTCLLTFHLLTSRGENTPIFVQNTTLVITQKISKGGLISESLSLWLHLSKNVPNHYFELYFSLEKILRIVFVTFFMEIGVNVKIFLRLSHLEQFIILKLFFWFLCGWKPIS